MKYYIQWKRNFCSGGRGTILPSFQSRLIIGRLFSITLPQRNKIIRYKKCNLPHWVCLRWKMDRQDENKFPYRLKIFILCMKFISHNKIHCFPNEPATFYVIYVTIQLISQERKTLRLRMLIRLYLRWA